MLVVPMFWLSACAAYCDCDSVSVIDDSELKFYIMVKLLWCNLIKYHVKKQQQTINVHCIGKFFLSALHQNSKYVLTLQCM